MGVVKGGGEATSILTVSLLSSRAELEPVPVLQLLLLLLVVVVVVVVLLSLVIASSLVVTSSVVVVVVEELVSVGTDPADGCRGCP